MDLSECSADTLDGPGCEPIRSLVLPDELPPARGNRYADDEAAANLGFGLFFNSQLGGGVSCATCHAPEFEFTDRKAVSTGKGVGRRNAPTTFNTARLSVMFWDGSADSLWSQPLFAIENPVEMGSSRLAVVHFIAESSSLRPLYEQVFGALPDVSGWPREGKPGDPAFDGLDAGVQFEVNQVAARVGKALEAYMRKNTSGYSAFDVYFLTGEAKAFSEEARKGVVTFIQKGCPTCHAGPMLTDERFHDVGFPSQDFAEVDTGRAGGIPILQANVFNLAGPFADPGTEPEIPALVSDSDLGAFRTPSLRGVARTAPFGHDGALDTLSQVLDAHAPGIVDPERAYLLSFFQTLSGAMPERPWSNWPAPE